MLAALLSRIFNPHARELCGEGKALRAEWQASQQPTRETAPERLALYEERRVAARAAWIGHRLSCPICLGEAHGLPTDPHLEGREAEFDGRESSLPGTRKAA